MFSLSAAALTGYPAALLLTVLLILLLRDKLPQDHGRAYAVNGEKSRGKARGTGVVFIPVFAVLCLVLLPFSWELAVYLFLTLAAMLTGYLDDCSELPWSELKKGLLDLAICLVAVVTFMNANQGPYSLSLFGSTLLLPRWVFFILAVFVLWAFINCCNCSDGVDGLFGTLASIALGATGYALYRFLDKPLWGVCALILMGCLGAYLLFNASPCMLMMGDAGSRAIGLFLGILMLETGNVLLSVPFAVVILLNGGLGLLKLSVMRLFHTKKFMAGLRTPLHDECRKNRGWSDTQTVFRFAIAQLLCAMVGLLAMGLMA